MDKKLHAVGRRSVVGRSSRVASAHFTAHRFWIFIIIGNRQTQNNRTMIALNNASRSTLRRLLLSSPCDKSIALRFRHFSSSSSSSSSSKNLNPLEVINGATDALDQFSTRLCQLSDTVSKDITLPSGQVVTLKDIVMHSRDADLLAFQSSLAKTARSTIFPTAESIETELKQMAHSYVSDVMPRMEQATLICKETPCGGATWQVDFSSAMVSKIHVEGNETPCGRLHNASLAFLEQTYDTREQVALGSRAALILRLAEELGLPLTEVRNSGVGQRKQKRIQQVFSQEKVPTPWMRSPEEYGQFFKLKEEMAAEKKKKK
jgi:hypothetical protein